MAKVGIIDYGMGNLTSVRNAFVSLGIDTEILSTKNSLSTVSHLVLPGVGAFGDAMKNLKSREWDQSLKQEVLYAKKPLLGICLGMQLLADTGTEHGEHAGLGLVRGRVVRLSGDGGKLRVPHVGWNDVSPVGAGAKEVFYFVHSFHFVPENEGVIDGWCDYGGRFAASLSTGNIRAVQFHPEKSQKAGLRILEHFVKS